MRSSRSLVALAFALVTGGAGLAGCGHSATELEARARYHDQQARAYAAAGDYESARDEANDADHYRRKAHKQAAKENRPPRVEMGVPTETQPPSNMMSAPPYSGQRVY